jgi:RNA polymerase sigma factor (sigma-70 family)
MNNKLTKQQQELVEKNHNLIYGFANKNKLNIDEYYGILAIGLCKAAKSYEESKGEFSTFAYNCMKNELYKYWNSLRSKRIIPNEMIYSYDALRTSEDSDVKDNYVNVIADNNLIDYIIESDILKNELFDLLSEKDKIVADLLINGMIYEDIAAQMNCTRQMVGYRVKRIRKKCADYLSKR